MGLNNSQYNTILRDYDAKQAKIRRTLEQRVKKVYQLIPEYKDLEQQIVANSMECAKASLLYKDPKVYEKELEKLKSQNLDISMQKIELLKENGFPIDYLTPNYHCDFCKDTGFVNNQRCHCFKQAVIQLLYNESLISRSLEHENFDSFRHDLYSNRRTANTKDLTPYENIQKVLEKCHKFINSFEQPYPTREHKNLLIYGNTGVGKTFLANCIAREILNNAHSVVYITASELFDIFSIHSFEKGDKFEIDSKLEYINTCDLLIIDDLGTELSNSFTNSQLYSCINNRLLKNLSVIISTNYQLKELQQAYSERIFSRIIGEYTILRIIGDDIRIKYS